MFTSPREKKEEKSTGRKTPEEHTPEPGEGWQGSGEEDKSMTAGQWGRRRAAWSIGLQCSIPITI